VTREELIALYGQECRTCKRWSVDTCLGPSTAPHDRDTGNLGICQLGPVPMWGHEGCDKYEVLEAPHDAVAEGGGGVGVKTHELKCWPEHFSAILDGTKTFELRLDDRGFEVGDLLILKEFQQGQYSGRDCVRGVTHIIHDVFGTWLQPGVVAMSLRRVRD